MLEVLAALSELLEEAAGAAAGVEAAGAAVDWAKAGPAMRAAATTGTRYFNIGFDLQKN